MKIINLKSRLPIFINKYLPWSNSTYSNVSILLSLNNIPPYYNNLRISDFDGLIFNNMSIIYVEDGTLITISYSIF